MRHPTPTPDHEQFKELCALMTIGELSDAEQRDLQEHLGQCPECQALCGDFSRIAADHLGFVAAQRIKPEVPVPSKEPSAYLARMLERLQSEREVRGTPAASPKQKLRHLFRPFFSTRWRTFGFGAAAGVAMLAAGLFVYQQYERLEVSARSVQARAHSLQDELDRLLAIHRTDASLQSGLHENLAGLQAERDKLARDLSDAQSKVDQLRGEVAGLNSRLAQETAKVNQSDGAVQQFRNAAEEGARHLTEAEARLQSLLAENKRLGNEHVQARLEATTREHRIAELESRLAVETASLERTQKVLAAPGSVPENLFAARDLHIVDVYDVDGEGRTKRTFGRVYFVEKKLLVFYAFDLQSKRRNQPSAGFQAWGYKELASLRPENLGLFHLDDPAASRWILRVDDARILEHIDAVFVTLEPPAGSPIPKGRRLLYANLAGIPNHP